MKLEKHDLHLNFSPVRSHGFLLLLLFGCFGFQFVSTPGLAFAQAAPSADNGSLDALKLQPEFAKEFIEKTFVACSGHDSVFWELPGAVTNPFGCPRTDFFEKPTTSCRQVIEYQHMQFSTRAEPLSAADKANGIEWRGYLTASWPISRARGIANNTWEVWGQWGDNASATPADFVQLIKQHGTWSVGAVGAGILKIPIPYSLIEQTKLPSCTDLMSDARHPEGQAPAHGPLLTSTIPERNPPIYQGSIANFHMALQGDVERSANEWGYPPHSFEKEIEYIYKVARLCASITPQVASSGVVLPSQINQEYSVCNPGIHGVTAFVRSYDHTRERGLAMTITPIGPWSASEGIIIRVMFTGLPGDGVTSNLFKYYGVVQASLKMQPLPPGTQIELPKTPFPMGTSAAKAPTS